MSFAHKLLQELIVEGTLRVVRSDGSQSIYGSGKPEVTWKLNKPKTLERIARNPLMNLGETYMREEWDVGDGTLTQLLKLLRSNAERRGSKKLRTVSRSMSWVNNWNNIKQSIRNVKHHYDLDEALFRSFLDKEMHYSCAYYARPDLSLEEAQQLKSEHIAKKLILTPGAKVLDIGCGWGSLAIYLASNYDVSVTGITLSTEQLETATRTAAERNLADKVQFKLQDYRNHEGQYDAIVSVGMFEHVGKRNYPRFFEKVQSLLKPDGAALLHTIGNSSGPEPHNPWFEKYVFPGGYIPAGSEILPAIEDAQLVITDLEVWRKHYAKTLKEWLRRFTLVRPSMVQSHGETFCRMWEYYLCLCQTAFDVSSLVVFQFQLGHNNDSAPLTRDYLYS